MDISKETIGQLKSLSGKGWSLNWTQPMYIIPHRKITKKDEAEWLSQGQWDARNSHLDIAADLASQARKTRKGSLKIHKNMEVAPSMKASEILSSMIYFNYKPEDRPGVIDERVFEAAVFWGKALDASKTAQEMARLVLEDMAEGNLKGALRIAVEARREEHRAWGNSPPDPSWRLIVEDIKNHVAQNELANMEQNASHPPPSPS